MNKYNIIKSVLNLPRFAKQFAAITCDFFLCVVAVIAAFYLRLDQFVSLNEPVINAIFLSIILALPIFWMFDLYRIIFRYSDISIIFSVFIAVSTYSLIYFIIITLYRIEGIPRSIGILQPMLLFLLVSSSRLLVKFVFDHDTSKKKLRKNTLIYGAGNAGRQVATTLENSFNYKLLGFLDDNRNLQGSLVQGKEVYLPDDLESLINDKEVDLILLALPSISRFNRNQILKKLSRYKVIVNTLPSLSDIIHGKLKLPDIKEMDVNDVLNREVVPPIRELLEKNIRSKTVMVTGAGGSIGSEICRQVIKCSPKRLVLCEMNEYSLYKIFEELKDLENSVNVIPLLVNVQNENKVNNILKVFKVDSIYHAAAYKHVPLVETNICEGIQNNVFSTLSVARSAIKHDVSCFVLISSDKAVRPTNVMGATKRLAELCVQALYYENKKKNINEIKMSMVRFGNVIDSSGSVIPKFKNQIKQGGPITLTHPDVTRFFMTIPEAAQLVIQAGAMSEESDVFVLDMGESIKIKDLIYSIVNLSGLQIKDKENPNGDIEIKLIGLRPGEKLYEELLLGDNPKETEHKKIKKSQDPYIKMSELSKELEILRKYVDNYETNEAKKMLKKIINTYNSNSEIVDYFYNERKALFKKIK